VQLFRSHGLGNDYLIVEQTSCDLEPGLVRALCDRHRGVGADGILEPRTTSRADYGLRIWNADGSVAEKSGNGLRIFARWLVDHRRAAMEMTMDTCFECVHARVGQELVAVDMGRGKVKPAPELGTELGTVFGADWMPSSMMCVDVGNPHLTCFYDHSVDDLPWHRWAAELETHARFPNRTNVGFAQIVNRRSVSMRSTITQNFPRW